MKKIRCCTYNLVQEFNTVEEAKAFFLNCMKNSEGSEQSRYVRVYTQLLDGHTYCTDNERATEEDLKNIEKYFNEKDKVLSLQNKNSTI